MGDEAVGHWTRTKREDGQDHQLRWVYWIAAIAGTIGMFLWAQVGLRTAEGASIAKPALVAAVFALLSWPAWAIGDAIRRFVMPSSVYTRDFMGALREKLFWLLGPQCVALVVLALGTVWATGYFTRGIASGTAESPGAVVAARPGVTPPEPAAAKSDAPVAIPDELRGTTGDRSLSISEADDGTYTAIVSNEEGCTGMVERLNVSTQDGIWIFSDAECVLTVRQRSDGLDVAESQSCDGYRGMRCSFEGSYAAP